MSDSNVFKINSDKEKEVSLNVIDKSDHAPIIPIRYIVAVLVILCTVNLYMCRINLSIAIVSMSKFNKSSGTSASDICDDQDVRPNSTTSGHSTGEFDWDESTQGVILGAFFYGYLVFQVVGGRLAELFGAKWLCAGGIAASVVINALTPMIARSGQYWLLIASRVVLGMFQAFIFPSIYALFSKWAPDHERSSFLSFPTAGSNLGTIATTALSGYLCDHGFDGGWPSAFYASAMIAVVWLIVWSIVVTSEPKDHPWITKHELNYINDNMGSNKTVAISGQTSVTKRPVPWVKMFTSKTVLALWFVKFTWNWNYILFVLKLPAYFQSVFKYSVSKNGLISSMIYVVLTASVFLNGFLADYLNRKQIISKTLLRKIFESFATIGSGICLAAIPLAGCNDTLVMAFLMIGMLLYGMVAGGDTAVVADMSRNFTATLFAIGNTIAFTTGVLTPLIIGYILEADTDHTRRQWGYVFYMSAAINIVGGIVFNMFGSADREDWDKDPEPVEHPSLPSLDNDKVITNI